jgi:pimeloyl-ACP methyl ester carboxylesterase
VPSSSVVTTVTTVTELRCTARTSSFVAVDAAIQRWMEPRWRDAEPGLADELRRTLLDNNRESYLAAYRVFATADAELWPRISRITAPTLAITGGDDPGSTPEMTRQLGHRIPGARFEIIESVRHLLPLAEPERLADAILAHTKDADRAHRPATS